MKINYKIKILLTLALFFTISTNAQHWRTAGNGKFPPPDDITTGSNYFGSIATFNIPINIETNGIIRMYIQGNPGFIGIGNGFTNPLFLLDVHGGDVNIGTTYANGYRIGGQYVLWHNGDPTNIFVGVGAGIVTIPNSPRSREFSVA